MSDDIVRWLRDRVWTDDPPKLDEAADEIERLRAELAALAPPSQIRRRRMSYDFRPEPCPGGYECRKDDELLRLKRERDDALHDHAAAMRASLQMKDRAEAAERKVEMLRGALKPFAEQVNRSPWIISPAMMRNAAAALADTEKQDG